MGLGHGAGERRGDGVPGLQDDRDRSAASTTCSAPSTTRAGTSGRSWWGDGCWRPSSAAPTAGAPTSPAEARRGPVQLSEALERARGAGGGGGRRRVRRASTCCRRATARCTCSRSTGFPAGRACRPPPGLDVAGAVIDQLVGPRGVSTPDEVAAAGQLACLLEVSAPKPGNVSPGRHFHDTQLRGLPGQRRGDRPGPRGGRRAPARRHHPRRGHRDEPVDRVEHQPRHHSAARARWPGRPCGRPDRCGTGRATCWRRPPSPTPPRSTPPSGARARAGWAPRPARTWRPPPTVALRDAMALAADRDSVAREYATDFATTFEVGVPALRDGPPRRTRLGRRHRRDVPADPRRAARYAHRAEAGPRGGGGRVAPRARGGGGRRRPLGARAAGARRRSTRSSGARPMPAIRAPPPTSPAPRCSSLY